MKLNSKIIKQRAANLGFNKVGIAKAGPALQEGRRLTSWIENKKHGSMEWIEKKKKKGVI